MRVISTCKMGNGTFEAKFIPLSRSDKIERIFVLREEVGPEIEKLEYIILPTCFKRIKPLKILIPFILAKHAIKTKSSLILGYHIIPHAFFALFASIITKIPFGCAQTGSDIQKLSRKRIVRLALKILFKRALFFNVPGKHTKDFWINFGVKEGKINLLHSTIDTNRFIKNSYIVKEYDFVILSRLSEEKRIEKLLKVFSELKNEGSSFSVCIAGDGPRRKFLENTAKELEVENMISFVGFVNNPEDWFNKSKIFLLSSESEGFPTALMQAMACELICVATNVGNISDTIVHGRNGFLIEYGDWQSYKVTILRLITSYNTTEMRQVAKQARESIIREHSFDVAIKHWDKLFSHHLPFCWKNT